VSTAEDQTDTPLFVQVFFAFGILAILAALGLVGWQVVSWLQDASWRSVSMMDVFGGPPETTQWIGGWKLLSVVPASAAGILLGVGLCTLGGMIQSEWENKKRTAEERARNREYFLAMEESSKKHRQRAEKQASLHAELNKIHGPALEEKRKGNSQPMVRVLEILKELHDLKD
jgi:hypothetical protein